MEEYISKTSSIEICTEKQKQSNENCTKQEKNAFPALTGLLNVLERSVFMQAAFTASHLCQEVENLMVSSLVAANMCVSELKALSPEIA